MIVIIVSSVFRSDPTDRFRARNTVVSLGDKRVVGFGPMNKKQSARDMTSRGTFYDGGGGCGDGRIRVEPSARVCESDGTSDDGGQNGSPKYLWPWYC